MKFFGRKPSPEAATPAAARSTPDATNRPVFLQPMLTKQMTFSLHQCTDAELNVTTRSMKTAGASDARFDVLLQARKTPLEAEWTLTSEQARELAAHLLGAAAECESVSHSTHALHRD